MSAEAKNFEAIVKAKAAHNKSCPFPPHTVRMSPFEIEEFQVITAPAEPLEIPAGPGPERETEPRF